MQFARIWSCRTSRWTSRTACEQRGAPVTARRNQAIRRTVRVSHPCVCACCAARCPGFVFTAICPCNLHTIDQCMSFHWSPDSKWVTVPLRLLTVRAVCPLSANSLSRKTRETKSGRARRCAGTRGAGCVSVDLVWRKIVSPLDNQAQDRARVSHLCARHRPFPAQHGHG